MLLLGCDPYAGESSESHVVRVLSFPSDVTQFSLGTVLCSQARHFTVLTLITPRHPYIFHMLHSSHA